LVGRAGRRAASFYADANRRLCPFAEPEDVLANYLAGAVKTVSRDSSLVRQKHVIFDRRSGAAGEPSTPVAQPQPATAGKGAAIHLATVLQCT
jgi:hypothetical protein